MKKFDDVEEAFQFFLADKYKKLSTADKMKVKDAKYNYLNKRQLTRDKMIEIMSTYSGARINIEFDD